MAWRAKIFWHFWGGHWKYIGVGMVLKISNCFDYSCKHLKSCALIHRFQNFWNFVNRLSSSKVMANLPFKIWAFWGIFHGKTSRKVKIAWSTMFGHLYFSAKWFLKSVNHRIQSYICILMDNNLETSLQGINVACCWCENTNIDFGILGAAPVKFGAQVPFSPFPFSLKNTSSYQAIVWF